MPQLHPYIHFNGNAEEAFGFYRSVFGGELSGIRRYGDLSSPEYPIPPNDAHRIMHIALPIGKSLLLGSDVMEMMGQVTEKDNRNSIFVDAESRDEADRIFTGISEGGRVEMPIADGPLGAYFGMVTDKYGVQWMVRFGAA